MGARRYSSAMLTLEQMIGFLVAAIVITASPGPDNLMVLGVGISKGRRQGIAFGLGCALGCLSHTVLAAVGVSALIASSPVAFTVLKVCGGLYLVWLGINALRSRGGVQAGPVKTAGAIVHAPVLSGCAGKRDQPEGGAVLSFVPAAVRDCGPRQRCVADRGAGRDLHRPGRCPALACWVISPGPSASGSMPGPGQAPFSIGWPEAFSSRSASG